MPLPVLGDAAAGPWIRVCSIVTRPCPGSAGHDFLDVLPAVAVAARTGKPFVAGWLCRAAGAPLEFLTNAVLPPPADGQPEPAGLLFPPGPAAARRARAGGRGIRPPAGPLRGRADRRPRPAVRLARGGRAHRPARGGGGRVAHPGDGAAPA